MAQISGSANVEEVPWPGDIDNLFVLPEVFPASSLPFYLYTPRSYFGIYQETWNDGTWIDGYRGIIYLKIANTGSASANITLRTVRVADSAFSYPWSVTFVDTYTRTLAVGEEYIFEIDLAPWLHDLFIISVNTGGADGIELRALQTTPFSIAKFWTSFRGQQELA